MSEEVAVNANPSPEQTTWGVGPWVGELPTDEHFDPELLAGGDTRNVLDKYRYWSMAAIVADLDVRRHNFHVAIENWQHDLNIGSIVRTANAFLAAEVHIIGHKRWNRRGAMVTDRYQHVRHHNTVEEFIEWAKTGGDAGDRLPILAIDNVPGCSQIETYAMPKNCVLLFGQEGPGLSEAAIAAADVVLEISQFGSTRSINASAAAAITMHSWVMQHVFSRAQQA
ncbi:MAG: TrmH family RNA methyltransferase [Actinomycetes bacterium]